MAWIRKAGENKRACAISRNVHLGRLLRLEIGNDTNDAAETTGALNVLLSTSRRTACLSVALDASGEPVKKEQFFEAHCGWLCMKLYVPIASQDPSRLTLPHWNLDDTFEPFMPTLDVAFIRW